MNAGKLTSHMKNDKFKKTRLAVQLSLIIGALASPTLLANEQASGADQTDMEVINVTGIRGSLIRAMDIKKDNYGVVDAISAEDIGKFPDTNLAESLQRITGVSIDRSDGEGSRVTIRGFGSDNNMVLLNGRQMPTPSRSFDFADLASESVSMVEVFKTGRASTPTGGLGGTINIITPRPLALGDEKASLGVKGVRDLSTEKGDTWTPEVSGMYSNTFMEGKLGVAFTGSFQQRDSGNKNATVNSGWKSFISGQEGNADGALPNVDPEGAHLNKPAAGVTYAVPQNMIYQMNETSRERFNGQVVIEYQPVEDLTARVDYTVSQVEVARDLTDISAWFSRDYRFSTMIWSEPNAENVAYPIQYQDTNNYKYAKVGEGDGDGINTGRGVSGSKNINSSLGLNLRYNVNDNLELELDFHDAKAEVEPNGPYSAGTLVMISKNKIRNTVDFTQDIPVLSIEYPDHINSYAAEDLIGAGSLFSNHFEATDLTQIQAKGRYFFDEGIIESVHFGISQTEVKSRWRSSNANRNTWSGVGTPDQWNDSWFTPKPLGAEFDKIQGHADPDMLANYFDWDFDTIGDFTAANFYTGDENEWPCGPVFCGGNGFKTDRITEEKMLAAYVQFDLAFDIGNMPATLVTGLRYEKTDTASSSKVPIYERIEWISTNELFLRGNGDVDFSSAEGSYSNTLPSFDLSVEVLEDVFTRFSYSKTISRPSYSDMQGGKILQDQMTSTVSGKGQEGNPGLLPLESQNIDLTFEWYYDEGSYLAVGYFRKDVDNYIGFANVTETAFGLTNPAQGPRADEAKANGAQDRVAIRDYIENNFIDRDDVFLNSSGNVVVVGAPEDRLADFVITIPVNQKSTWIDGYELAVQHVFESGFGVMANATFVNPELKYDNASVEQQFVLTGASDTANIVGFYENEDFSVRVAYNWRDDFLAGVGNNEGVDYPVYTEAYGQVDINVSYNVTDKLQVFAEGINVTDEHQRQFSRHEQMLVNLRQQGARFNLGARYTF